MLELKSRGDVYIPHQGQKIIDIPIPPEYKGGRRESYKMRYIWCSAGFVVSLFISIGILLSNNGLLINILIVGIFEYLVILIIRYILGEGKYRKELQDRYSRDYEISSSNFWGIKRITENDFCYFRQGNVTGVFVLFEKGSITGTGTAEEFEHYQSISNGLNELSRTNISFIHIDLMDFAGSDIRLYFAQKAHESDSDSGAKEIRKLLFDSIISESENTVATYDIFLFMVDDDDLTSFEYALEPVIQNFMMGNFSNYKVLNYDELRNIAESLFNLHYFNLADTMRDAFQSANLRNIFKLIESTDIYGNTQKHNKTLAEQSEFKKEQEIKRKLAEEEKKRKKKELKKSGLNKNALEAPKSSLEEDLDSDLGLEFLEPLDEDFDNTVVSEHGSLNLEEEFDEEFETEENNKGTAFEPLPEDDFSDYLNNYKY